jgi:Protein of unknown function (DUF1186)/SEC-C motif
MEPAKILDEFTDAEGLPKAALRAASEQRATMVPLFLAEIEGYLALAPDERAKPTPIFFIFHLLGEWREKSAYRRLARLLRIPSHELEVVLGDAITTTSHRVMAAVCDGDPEPLYEIILDPKADEFIRSRMCNALAMVVLRGEINRADAARFLRGAFNEIQPQTCCYVWQGWQSAISMLGLSELTILVRRAFDRGFIDPQWLRFEHFQRNLDWAIKHPGVPRHPQSRQFTLFGDTIDELSRWDGFRENAHADLGRNQQDNLAQILQQPYQNPHLGIGRNDPCLCGSGKKFKNCCLAR